MSNNSNNSDVNDSFQFQRPRGYRLRAKAKFGSNTCNTGSAALGGVKKCSEVFVFNVRTDITTEIVKEYVTNTSNESGGTINVIECRKVSKDDARTNSFVIMVFEDDAPRMLNSDFWPENVGFRRFWPKRGVRESKRDS